MNSAGDLLNGGVSPFGHPRINDRSHLPAAFRSVPRPSSPLGAKASTERPYHAPITPKPPARRTKPRNPQATRPTLRPSSKGNTSLRSASLSLTQTSTNPRFTCQRTAPTRTRLSRGGLLEAAAAGDRSPGRGQPDVRPPEGSLAGHRERRAEPDDPAVVLFR